MTQNILMLPGDGIGQEVCAEVKKIIGWLNKTHDTDFTIEEDLIGGTSIDNYGVPLSDKTVELAKEADSVLLGSVGGPKWDNIERHLRPERGLLGIRKALDLFANLRPAITFDELIDSSSLKAELVTNLDIIIIRELTGGIYFGEPRGIETKNNVRTGINSLVYHDYEVIRVAKVAFDIAKKRQNSVCSVDKANVLEATEMWRDEVQKLHQKDYESIKLSHMYVDNAAMQLVRSPKQFDVILTNNMFGDILSDIAAMLTGSLGMLPSASLGEMQDGKRHALYEPVHGSAPDIAGKNIANPLATILSFEMMLRYSFNLDDIANKLNKAVKNVLAKGYRTLDIATKDSKISSTTEMGDYVVKELEALV